MADTLTRLEATIASRTGADPASSYVASLFAKGRGTIARKFGEEAVETIVAALGEDKSALAGEAADTLFHLMILLADAGIRLADVLTILEQREGTSGHDEKANRPS
ncbi:phosphoribosyl-ATP diphosphatase [Sphingomonas crusticola]|uniref:phosphoribosyl-ATP diphosphatase n=1 Tax=Sphingomonas crusticola TaxID=1697973 RepID=UPI000E21D56F|nr:phosphoribosyl-ATP diphosphatase [Sphingomonas crusticola]